MSARKLANIPSVHTIEDEMTRKAIGAIKEILDVREGRIGEKADMNVTFQDLVDLGLITKSKIPR